MAALFFLFNTGQLTSEKTKLVNTADAVAYSAGVMHARALNFDAYNNRALVANEVLVAQMVSLASWASYANQHVQNLPSVFPECATEAGALYAAAIKFDPIYGVMCYFFVGLQGVTVDPVPPIIPATLNAIVTGIESSKAAITSAQRVLHTPLFFERARGDVMQAVADRNYQGDGAVRVEPMLASAMIDDWRFFTHRFQDDERTRLANLARTAAATDSFVRERNWTSRALLAPPGQILCRLLGVRNSVRRRGGTELVGLDEWQAADTESFWEFRDRRFLGFRTCTLRENPIAFGGQEAAVAPAGNDSGAFLGGSQATNPNAHSQINSGIWPQYTGIPSFYDLATAATDPSSANLPNPQDPRLKFAVRLVRDRTAVRTSDGASQIRPSPRLNNFNSNLAGQVMSAIATSEVYFDHPPDPTATGLSGGSIDNRNRYATDRGNPATREIGSLFNPYWQVRLIPNSATDITVQQVRQGLAP